MGRRVTWLRLAALLTAGALAVHELRYVAAYGRHTEEALNEQGHAYLTVVGPLVAVLIAAAIANVVLALARGTLSGRPAPLSFCRAWLSISPALFGIFAAQELAEGVLASGHEAGMAAVFAGGGWLAIVFALAVGALLAWVVREVPAAVAAAAGTLRAARLLFPAASLLRLDATDAACRAAGPLRHLAARGPPVTSA